MLPGIEEAKYYAAMERLNDIYAEMKLGKERMYYCAPEAKPSISSTQIRALLALLVEKGALDSN